MKKLTILIFLLISSLYLSTDTVQSETIEYPFNQIRIVAATQFTVTLDSTPDTSSILSGNVDIGDTFTVYIGDLEFMNDTDSVDSTSSIMILTDSEGNDFLQWIVNSSSQDLESYEQVYYASWILIDPEVGVIKNFDVTEQEVGYYHDLSTAPSTYSFIDNLGNSYAMDDASLETLTDLDIIISAYEEATSQ